MRRRPLCVLVALTLPGVAAASTNMLLGVRVAGLRQPARNVLVREDAGRYYIAPRISQSWTSQRSRAGAGSIWITSSTWS